jgi:hypothetical protein
MRKNKKGFKKPAAEQKIPNPGSDEALYLGCTCPVLDNYYGEGWIANGERQFWIAQDCPLHNQERK